MGYIRDIQRPETEFCRTSEHSFLNHKSGTNGVPVTEINAIGVNNLGQKPELSVYLLGCRITVKQKTAILLSAAAILTALSAARTTHRPAAVRK